MDSDTKAVCPNCREEIFLYAWSGTASHVSFQQDCRTGEVFRPVERVIEGKILPLLPDDYSCFSPEAIPRTLPENFPSHLFDF